MMNRGKRRRNWTGRQGRRPPSLLAFPVSNENKATRQNGWVRGRQAGRHLLAGQT